MEGMDGMALFNEIRRAHPLLPVIILTAMAPFQMRSTLPRMEFSAFSPSLSTARR